MANKKTLAKLKLECNQIYGTQSIGVATLEHGYQVALTNG
jgi:hypothetical protein